MSSARERFLVIRRDNIGDLVCTTPLIAALRRARPGAFIAALVNSYNREVLDGNPHLDRVYAYGKAKQWIPSHASELVTVLAFTPITCGSCGFPGRAITCGVQPHYYLALRIWGA